MQEKVEQVQSFMGQASDLVDFDKNFEQIVLSQTNFSWQKFRKFRFPPKFKNSPNQLMKGFIGKFLLRGSIYELISMKIFFTEMASLRTYLRFNSFWGKFHLPKFRQKKFYNIGYRSE